MKRIRNIFTVVVLTFACSGAPLFAETFPQTNTLVAEIKVAPPEIAVGGQFGQFVAAKSNVFVATYKNARGVGTNTPVAAVFRNTEIGFEQWATLFVPSQANFSVRGIATDGSEIVLFGVENEISAIYVFARQQEQWLLETKLVPSEAIWSISISDGAMVAGAAFKALLFELKDSLWIESPILPPENIPAVVKNGFGASAVIDHGTIFIAAVGEVRSDPGRAYVYVKNGQVWSLQAELRPEDYTYVRFGLALAIDGDTALISSFPDRSNNCMVYLFQRSAGAWARIAILSPMGPQELFGRSLAVSGRNLVVGAPSARAGAGALYLFRRNGSTDIDRLFLYRSDTFHELLSGDSMGLGVASDANSIFISAPYHDAFAQDAGVAFLFNFEFGLTLQSAWARQDDNSFHFTLVDATIGDTYTIETASTFGADWITLKELLADCADMQVEVDIPTDAVGFFRVSKGSTQTNVGPSAQTR